MQNSRKLTASLAIIAALLLLLIMNWMATAFTSEPSIIEAPTFVRVIVIGLFQAIGLYLLMAFRHEFKTLLVSKVALLLLNLLLVLLALIMLSECVWFLFGGSASSNIFASSYHTLAILFMSAVVVLMIVMCAFGITLAINRSLTSRLLRGTGICLAAGSLLALVSIAVSTVAFFVGLTLLAVHFWQPTRHIDIV